MPSYDYAAHELPRTLSGPLLQKFSSLAREAARSIPSMVLYRQYELEWADETFETLLADEEIHWIICTAVSHDMTRDSIPATNSLEQGRWVGILSLHGPLSDAMQHQLQLDKHAINGAGDQLDCWAVARFFIKARHRETSRSTEQMLRASRNVMAKDGSSSSEVCNKCGNTRNKEIAVFTTVASHLEDSILFQYYADAGGEVVGRMSVRDCLELYGEIRRMPHDALGGVDDAASKLLMRFKWKV